MSHRLALAVCSALVLTAPMTLAAQGAGSPAVAPGTRVRVVSPALLHPMTGSVVTVDGGTLRLRADGSGDTVSLATSSLSRVDVSGGSHTHILRDTGIGLLAGFATGAVWGLAAYQKSDCAEVTFCYDYGPGGDAVAGGIIIGTVGMVAGLVVGSFAKEEWIPAAASGLPLRMGLSPAHDGVHSVALSASVRF